MSKYVDYNEAPVEPLKPESSSERMFRHIADLQKTRNPEDGLEYDIVVPVDLGKTVRYFAFNQEDNFIDQLSTFVIKHRLTDASAKALLFYIIRVMGQLAGSRDRLNEMMRTTLNYDIPQEDQHTTTSTTAAPKATKAYELRDLLPESVEPSAPVRNDSEDVLALAESLGMVPPVPVRVPCRFTAPLNPRASDCFMRTVMEASPTLVAFYYELLDRIRRLNEPAPDERLDQSAVLDDFVPSTYDYRLLAFALMSKKTIGAYACLEHLRYFALNPGLLAAAAKMMPKDLQPPAPQEPLCAHIAFVQLLANVMANSTIGYAMPGRPLRIIDTYADYLARACSSRSPDLLLALSVLLLNIAVLDEDAALGKRAARLYPRLLAAALLLRHQGLLRNVLLGLATLVVRDRAAAAFLATCPPLLGLLARAMDCSPDNQPYASFCVSCLEELAGH